MHVAEPVLAVTEAAPAVAAGLMAEQHRVLDRMDLPPRLGSRYDIDDLSSTSGAVPRSREIRPAACAGRRPSVDRRPGAGRPRDLLGQPLANAPVAHAERTGRRRLLAAVGGAKGGADRHGLAVGARDQRPADDPL